MKNRKLVSLIVLLVIVSLSCNYLLPTNKNDAANSPVVDFVTAAEPLNVTVQLDEASTTSSTITPAGGSLTLTAADGSMFTLEVPAKALKADTLITMTAVKSIAGAPLDDGPVAAVQLEPSGLFFNELLTLTIVPAQEIPIKNQIAFGYEGDGQDYHLAIVDPKSKGIKIILMEFSGAGVGSGGDAQWAANLQIQASSSRTRLFQKWGEATQTDHISALLGGDSNISGEMVDSWMDQFYDQVVLKEIAAAELDCTRAQQAVDDLILLERLRQLLGGSSSGAAAEAFSEKALHLADIAAKCKTAYRVSGSSGPVKFTGQICSLTQPFVLNGTFSNGSETQSFTPSSAASGTVTESGNSGGCEQSGSGSYTITLSEEGTGELQWTIGIHASCPPYSADHTYTFVLPLQPAPDLSCP